MVIMPDYKGLASLMDEYHDVSIFRRFRRLNLQNLLHMQAELVHVEQELQEIHGEDSRSNDPVRRSFQTNWKVMENSFRSGGDNLQRTKLLEAREKLEKYSKLLYRPQQDLGLRCLDSSLLTQAHLNALRSPKKQSLEILRDWLRRPGYGNSFLQGFERRTWEDVEPADMVVLQKDIEDHDDPLTRWLLRVIPGFFHDRWGHRWKVAVRDQERGDQELFVYKDSNFAKFTTAVTTFLSTVFPVVSIFVLYYVKAMVARLGLILAFTSLFSLALLIVSRVRRVEIFMATSAYVPGAHLHSAPARANSSADLQRYRLCSLAAPERGTELYPHFHGVYGIRLQMRRCIMGG